MSNNISKHTLGLTQLQSGQGTPTHQAPLGTLYIDVTTSEYYKNTDGLTTWGSIGSGGLSGDYLPLSGGTVTGGVIFTSGITVNTISEVDYIDFKTSPSVPSPTGGTLYFDYNENALSYKPVTNQNDVTVNIGQESLIRIYNDTGTVIYNGQVLHITGATSGIPTVALANASKLGATFTDSLAQSSGVATHDIPSGEFGFMTNFGIVRDLNTSGFTPGQELFLSDTIDGGITNDPNSIAFTSRISTIGWCLSASSTSGKIYVKIENENPLQSLTQQELNVLVGNTISTGVYEYTGMTTASSTTVNVSPMRGWLVYNTYEYSTNPLVLNIYYSGGTNIPVTNIATADSTYILITSALTVTQQVTFPTPQQRRENIYLGKVNHPNRTSILNINNTVDYDVSPMSALRDLWSPIKYINQGIIPSPNGANLSFNTSAGTLWGNGINWHNNQLNPNSVSISGKTPASFFYRTQTGGTSSSVTVIDPTKYDVNGVITSVGGANSNDATNQRIYLYPTGVINVLYGQTPYTTLAAAIAAIQSETFIPYPNAESTGILIGVISVRNDIVADGQPLTNTDYAKFTLVSKFGESFGGTGGLSTTTLQQAYDNSTTPEIITNATLGALSIKNGTGNADNVTNLLEGVNASGNTTSFIRADGSLSATSITGYSATFNDDLSVSGDTNLNSLTSTSLTVNGNTYITGNTSIGLSLSAGTFTLTTSATTNNTETSLLVRNTTTGNIETRTLDSLFNIVNEVTVGLPGSVGVDFNSIKSAVDSITGATSANTYVVKVGPGVFYENPITMKSYVDVVGSSETNTIIQANDPNTSLIIGADQSMISDVQIQGCTGTSVSAVVYSSPTTPQLNAIFYVENVRFGANYTHARTVGTGGGNCIMQCSNVKYGGYPFTVGFHVTNDGSGVGRMQLRNVTSTNGGVTTTSGLIFAKADKPSCAFIVNGCLLTKATAGGAAGVGFWVEDGGSLRLTAVNFQRWETGIYAPQVGSAPSIEAIALNFENCTTDVNILHSGATGKIQGTDSFLKTKININAPLYEVNKDPRQITVAKKGGDFSSIKSAVDYLKVSGNTSSSNRFIVSVGPGIFSEGEIDLTYTPYVSIVGSNIQTTLIIPTGNTQNIIKLGISNEISFLSLSGAPSPYAAIYCDDIGDFGQAHKVSMYDCDTNVWVKSSTKDTKFYGEYLDFNGNFTYGLRTEATNNYLSLINIENSYNFPSGSNVVYCNYAKGSGATINSFLGDNVSNGVSGSTAFYIQDGASLNASTITVDGFTYGIRNPNIGSPIRFDVDNASMVGGEWDLYVENQYTFGTFGGSSSHQKVYTVSPDVYWLFLDVDDGELDITRKASVTFADGTHTDLTTLLFNGSSMGLMSGGSLSIVSGLTVNTSAGFGYLGLTTSTGVYKRIDWVNSQIILSPNTNSYVYINENETLSSSGSKPNSVNNIILGRVVTNLTAIQFIDPSPFHSDHTSNRFGNLFREALGSIYSFGTVVTENTTPFKLDVTAGEYYYSTNEFKPSGGTGINFTQFYRDGSGGWITSTADTITNTSYDGNGSLSALTASAFTKHTLYLVGDGSYEKYFLVLGQNQYTTLVQTENALLPTPPTYFNDSVVQIASIYVQQGTTGITQVEDIKPTVSFRAGGVNASSLHANLLGLSSDDHTQYLLVNGGRAMTNNLDMGGNQITNVGNVDGVDVSDHKTRHQFGGSDTIGTTTPTANAIPYADVSGTLDSWISTGSTSTLGKVKISTAAVSPSNPIVVGENDLRFTSSFTAVSYSNNVLTFTNVSGNNIIQLINTVTGWTVNGDLLVTGSSSASTVTLTSTPTFNNDNTQILTRNSTTGNIEYSDSSSAYVFNYGIANAMINFNFLT